MIRGKAGGVEILFSGRPFADAYPELLERLALAPDFYRGTRASVCFETAPSADELGRLAATLAEAGIEWDGTYRLDPSVAVLGARKLKPSEQPRQEVALSDAARSLVADFAGARADLAGRRRRGASTARGGGERRRPEAAPTFVQLAQPAPTVLYHRGTLRGGQSLANVGHVVVIGDVNPGAEIVAGGDIVVFGALRGVAHAGAQGDRSARVYALVLAPTQLRIATTIAAGAERAGEPAPEEAFLADGADRIAIVPAGGPRPLRTAAEQA
jgi:septum site-determining protein MinC